MKSMPGLMRSWGLRSLVLVALGAAMVAGAGGCETPSVHPIYFRTDPVVNEPGLAGTWKQDDSRTTYTVTQEGSLYKLVVKNNDAKDPKQWEFGVRTVRLGETNFADFAAPEAELKEHAERWGPLFLPTHMFAAWALEGDKLTVRLLDRDWLRSSMQDGLVSFATTRLPDDSILIASPTEDLQEFLKAYGTNKKAFSAVVELERVKP